MITTPNFAFVHMHKTGGQSLINIIGQNIGNTRMIGYHYPIKMLPSDAVDLPIVGMVRNPWDWYISWYAFNTRPNVSNPLFFILSDGFQADYRQTLKNLICLSSNQASSQHYRRALIDILPETLDDNNGVGLTKESIRELESSEHGYYSWQFRRMHGEMGNNLHIGRFENLQDDFLSIMRTLTVEEADAMQSSFEKMPKLNASSHSHYSQYLDTELKDLIADKDDWIINQFDYEFEHKEAQSTALQFPSIQIGRKHDNFHKLSGKERNFLLLEQTIDLSFIKRKLKKITEQTWNRSGREKTYEVHKQTQSLLLIHDDDFRHYKPTYHPAYDQFKKELKPVFESISRHYGGNGFIARTLFARLSGRGKIDQHTDGLFSLLKCHRIHIPVKTNDEVVFTIGGEEKVLKEGEMWEINNATLHAVENRSDESRIHLIIDWVPNSTVRPEDKKSPVTHAGPNKLTKPGYNGKSVGRNEPCPCNSGKKFKQCHGANQ
ncbi:MAG: hypothetical protein ACI845_004254 [Gammaproteobacteria bacterium]|jgi:hypothetical protein